MAAEILNSLFDSTRLSEHRVPPVSLLLGFAGPAPGFW
jgi:hypothetical protein